MLLKYRRARAGNMKLIIVESPAKCKKIEEYLGEPYKCMASYGHMRVLKELSQIDVTRGYKVTYAADSSASKKRQNIARLREAITAADEVILATDDDREGEAIAWHICDMFNLPIATTPRAVFHEITKVAVCSAVAASRTINMAMVAAQQARQVIDLLVGFKITPLLWRNVCANRENPLSAGRCQTPALRLIYDNDCVVRDSALQASASNIPQKYRAVGYFTTQTIPFELITPSELTAPTSFLEAEKNADDHYYEGHTTPTVSPHQPPRPFTTSRLQQAAGGSVKETMKIAQGLYEGGHITYMRTDAQTYSAGFIGQVANFISHKWGPEYNTNVEMGTGTGTRTGTGRPQKTKSTTKPKPQEAHEAIRPTHVEFTPELAKTKLDPRSARLYELIWTNTVKSLMPPAQIATYTATIISPSTKTKYTHMCSQIRFLGWKIVDGAAAAATTENSPEWDYLMFLHKDQATPFKTITVRPVFPTMPLHHTESGLVKMLEEMGIGRPSTFAMLVDKIQERDYVAKGNIAPQKIRCNEYILERGTGNISSTALTKEVGGEKGKLLLQPIGRIVSDFLNMYFAPILNYEYTSAMEKALDDIAAGINTMAEVCAQCDAGIMACVSAAASAIKIHHVFKKGTCELVVGRQGAVIRINGGHFIPLNTPYCETFDLNTFEKIRTGVINLEELIPIEMISMETPLSTASFVDLGVWGADKHLYIKTGKFGPYVSIVPNESKRCKAENKSLKVLGVRPLQQYTRDEVIDLLEGKIADNPNILRNLTSALSIRKGPKGTTYIYYKTGTMKKPAFYKLKGFLEDPIECPENVLLDWIYQKYPTTNIM